MADSISAAQDAVKASLKNIEQTMSKIADAMSDTVKSNINATEKSQDKINQESKNTHKGINELDNAAVKDQNKAKKQTADQINAETKSTWQAIGDVFSDKIKSAAASTASSVTQQFRSLLGQYEAAQQKLAFNLIGSGMNYETMQNALSLLSTSTIVKQNDVYQKLTSLVSSGITYNVAQRAFLATTAENVGLNLDIQSEKFNNLIQLYHEDLSSARLAQMAGLREFLQQNYANSQYIQQGFSTVSDALYEMQAIMKETNDALATEKVIQTYLGSFSSAGGQTSTATSIAEALGKIGSGDFNDLGNMQNLMIMAASRAGLSYADLLSSGLNESDTQKLMTSLFSYIASMQNAGGGSNVAMNAIAKIFGVNVSDIRAAHNMNVEGIKVESVGDSLAQFFADVVDSTNFTTMLSNWWANGISNQALTTKFGTVGFDLVSTLSDMASNILDQTNTDTFLGSLFGTNALKSGSKAIGVQLLKNAPAIGIIGSILSDSNVIGNLFNGKNLDKLLNGDIEGLIESILVGKMGEDSTSATINAFNRLGNFKVSGEYNSSKSGASRSYAMTNDEQVAADMARQDSTKVVSGYEELDTKDTTDIYNLLHNDFPSKIWATGARIVDGYNSVLIQSAEYTHYIGDMITLTAVSAEGILNLLEAKYLSGSSSSTLPDLTPTWSTSWSGTTNPDQWIRGA